MKKFRLDIITTFVMSLLFVILVSCTNPPTSEPATAQPAAAQPTSQEPASVETEQPTMEGVEPSPTLEPVEITVWVFTYQPYIDAVTELIDGFQQSQDQYRVSLETLDFDQYWAKLVAGVATDTGPDIQWGYTGNYLVYVSQGVYQPLPADQIPFDQMAPLVEDTKFGGQYWITPLGVRADAYYYNPDYFNEANLTPPTTWAEDDEVTRALTVLDANGNIERFGQWIQPTNQGYNIFKLRCHQAGGSHVSADLRTYTWTDPGCMAWMDYYVSWITDPTVWVDGVFDTWQSAYSEGSVGYFQSPSSVVGALKDISTPWDVAPVSAGPDNGATSSTFWGPVITSQAQGEKYDAALAFLKYVTTPEGNRIWARHTGDIPALLEVASEEEFTQGAYAAFASMLPNARIFFDHDGINDQTLFFEALDQIVLEGVDPATALEQAEQQAQQTLDEFWSNAEEQGLSSN
jgi:multiple sugar transport system substrate-binding protein